MVGKERPSFLKKSSKKLLRLRMGTVWPTWFTMRCQFTNVRWFFLSRKKIRASLAFSCGLLPAPALAHAFLDGAVPRVGSEIPVAPAEVVLHFTQGVETDFSKIEVQDSGGASVTTGVPHAAGDPTHFAVPIKKLPPGDYTVIWHVTSVDTHKTQGKFHFTVTH